MKSLALLLVLALVHASLPLSAAAATRIEELCDVKGVRANQLIGYGLVVGLANTGDTGNGIPPETQAKIFQAYYSTKKGGTGLGLAMAKRIAEEHGGALRVNSEMGKGSDFSIAIPIK